MISLKRLITIARKWKRVAGIKRRVVISQPRNNHKIFRELFRISEEQFGLPTDGPITLPCDSAFMEYVVSLVRKRVSLELENMVQLVASFGFGSDCQCLALESGAVILSSIGM
ncbi:unnamed protein product [Lupinus luteus]|uniref:Uncharacterized protein n=1 Tax=Lupinus luteus TaxID=3873 RepID=A0AAV1YJR6_LUPLU